MHYLIYVSQANTPMGNAELEDILNVSRQNNERDGLTGLLIYRFSSDSGRGHFIQMLEGEREAVRATYGRIADDPRHHTKILLEEGEMNARHFPNWFMGFKNADASELAAVPGFAELGEETFQARVDAGDLAGALDLMRSFYETDD